MSVTYAMMGVMSPINENEYVCPLCRGEGWEILTFSDGSETDEPCWKCDGAGVISISDD